MRLLSYYACVALLAGGCGPDQLGPKLRLVVAGQMKDVTTCPKPSGLSMLGADSLRITARVHDAAGTTSALCDVMVKEADLRAAPSFGYPLGSVSGPLSVDLFAEAWNAGGERLASGALYNQTTDALAVWPDLRLFATESFRCFGPAEEIDRPQHRMRQARAFHTATPLPNGQVLISGGLVASISGSDGPAAGDAFYIVGTVEVYDPPTGAFIQLTGDAATPLPRAFHNAALLPPDASGNHRVLLVGGVTTTSPQSPALHAYTGEGFAYTFRLTPVSVNGIGLKHQETVEVITYDPVAKKITRAPLLTTDPMMNADGTNLHPRGYQAGAQVRRKDGAAAGIVLAGGATATMGTLTLDRDLVVANDLKPKPRESTLPDDRLGGAMVALDDANALLVGGLPDTAQNPDPSPFMQLGIGGMAPPIAVPFHASAAFPNLQFATLTVLPTPAMGLPPVLVSGGLEVMGHAATNPTGINGGLFKVTQMTAMVPCGPMMMNMCPAYVVQPVTPGAPFSFDPVTCAAPQRWKPVAWNAATLLATRDRVLITGGTPTFVDGVCVDCDNTSDKSLLCATAQAALYNVEKSIINSVHPVSSDETLQIARFGHTQTLLSDGNVAIIGGFTRRKNPMMNWETFGVGEVELFNPGRRAVKSDASGDLDDPVRADLVKLGLKRAPAKTAADTNPMAMAGAIPFVTCHVPQ